MMKHAADHSRRRHGKRGDSSLYVQSDEEEEEEEDEGDIEEEEEGHSMNTEFYHEYFKLIDNMGEKSIKTSKDAPPFQNESVATAHEKSVESVPSRAQPSAELHQRVQH